MTPEQEMLKRNLENGSVQAFAEGNKVERRDLSGEWVQMIPSEDFLPDLYLYRVKRQPREWWEVRQAGQHGIHSTLLSPQGAQQALAQYQLVDAYIVHVREVIE